MNRINNFIYIVLLGCILSLVSVLFGKGELISIGGIIILIIVFIIMGNYFMKSHNKFTKRIDPDKIKVNLYTLLILTFLFSLMIFLTLISTVNKYFPTLFDSFPFIVFLVTIPPLYISNYLLDQSRLTFFRDKRITNIFITNIFYYSVISVIITIILSDIPIAMSIIKNQDIPLMIYWMIGFIFFIAQVMINIAKKSILFKLESKLMNIGDINV